MDLSSHSQPQNVHHTHSPQIQFNSSYSQPPNYVYFDYSNAYQNLPHQQLSETIVSNPPGLSPFKNEVAGAQIKEADGPPLDQQQSSSYYPALNATAAAVMVALSQLAQFAGTMDATERAVARLHTMVRPGPLPSSPSASQFPYKVGGRQGGGYGRFGHHKSPAFYQRGHGRARGRGRDRGRSGPKCFSPRVELFTSSHPESSAAQEAELKNENAVPSTDAPEKAAELLPESSLSAASEKVVLSGRPRKAAWFELCRVNCTSLEILEQHKNGKLHKKNLQRIEELRKMVKTITEVQNEQEPVAESKIEVSSIKSLLRVVK